MDYGKKKRMSEGGMPRNMYKHGGGEHNEPKRKQAAMGRYMYGHGGEVMMEGSQPKYKGTPKCMPN